MDKRDLQTLVQYPGWNSQEGDWIGSYYWENGRTSGEEGNIQEGHQFGQLDGV